ncbi:MAG: hypothetical protein ACJ8C4_17580 [Gemmataceae bacterium]
MASKRRCVNLIDTGCGLVLVGLGSYVLGVLTLTTDSLGRRTYDATLDGGKGVGRYLHQWRAVRAIIDGTF